MKNYKIQKLDIRPEMDLELFMAMSQEFKLDGKTAEFLTSLWGTWLDRMKVQRFTDGEEGHLLIWLDAEVEEEVQRIWDDSTYKGFLSHSLAQALVMAAARMLIPDLVEAGCAPLPQPEPGLMAAIEMTGLTWNKQGGLSRMYAILTPHPFTGGCEVCFLKKSCPNLKTKTSETKPDIE